MMVFNFLNNYWGTSIISFLLCLIITPLVIKWAHATHKIATPKSDRWHSKPTALMGGIAIFLSFSIAVSLRIGLIREYWQIIVACCVIFITGLIDDLYQIKPIQKLLAQLVCTFVLINSGFVLGASISIWIGIPLTFFWVVGITNAVNLLDNMDGLSAGISAIIAFTAAILSIEKNDFVIATIALTVAGSCIGFLVFNFKPAKIFMGDSGSLFLGFVLSFLSLTIHKDTGSSSILLSFLIPIGLMFIPIMDTSLVTFKRLLSGRRIDQGGRDHSSHRLVALGISEKKSVLILYAICILWSAVCIVVDIIDIGESLFLLIIVSGVSIMVVYKLVQVKVYNDEEEKLSDDRLSLATTQTNIFVTFFLMNKKLIVGLFVDIVIISCSFYISSVNISTVFINNTFFLPLAIIIKLVVFNSTKLYNRMWRYIGSRELAICFISCLIASIVFMVGGFLFGLRNNSFVFQFFLIDFFVTFNLLIFSRLVFRFANLLISNDKNKVKEKVIVYGAGDSGYYFVKEALENFKYDVTPIGFIDDNKAKHKMHLYGIKIIGGHKDIIKVCIDKKVNTVVVCIQSFDPDRYDTLERELGEHNIQLKCFKISASLI